MSSLISVSPHFSTKTVNKKKEQKKLIKNLQDTDFFFIVKKERCVIMFHAQLKLVCPETERFIRYENLSDQSLERLNASVDARMRELRPFAVVVNVKYWDDAFLWFRKGELNNGSNS